MSAPNRPTWDQYFMQLCDVVATRSTCKRKHVGVVIARENHLLSIGYNGSLPGLPHCEENDCDMEDGHCVRTIHSEANAICHAARHGVTLAGATLYTNTFPCWSCFKLIVSAGITEVVYKELYGDTKRVIDAWVNTSGFILRQVQ